MKSQPEKLLFGHMHEDHSVEVSLLESVPLRTALVIASGGDLAFTLAAEEFSVTAVDTNPAQIALVKRKLELAGQHSPNHCQQVFIGTPGNPGWCFSGRVDRVLKRIGPLLAYAYQWPDGGPRRWLIEAAFPFLKFGVRLVHGLRACTRIDARALCLLRTRFEAALGADLSAINPYLHVLMGNGFGHHPPRPWRVEDIARWKDKQIALETCSISHWLENCEPESIGLISVSNLHDVLDSVQWQALMDLAWKALAPGGIVVARSMIAESIFPEKSPFQPLPLPAQDLSPLCPVIWIGRKP